MGNSSKIFGIGLQRTGTTSLNWALKILGYNALDHPFVLYPEPDPALLEQHDAFTDNPIPLLYKQFDEAYPGSKFILTTRHVDSWLKSVKWLYSTGRIEFNWDVTNPIGNEVHEKLYGITYFDEQIFRKSWFAYHADVERYFESRPQDLLIIDFSKGDGWEKLCPFLEKNHPGVTFPRQNKSTIRRSLRIAFNNPLRFIKMLFSSKQA